MRISARTRLFVEILKEEGERGKRLRDLLAMLQKDRISHFCLPRGSCFSFRFSRLARSRAHRLRSFIPIRQLLPAYKKLPHDCPAYASVTYLSM